jgi:apolipoprotein N-acyltransferase
LKDNGSETSAVAKTKPYAFKVLNIHFLMGQLLFGKPSSIKSLRKFFSLYKPYDAGIALAALGGGLLMGLSPVNAWPLAWIALVPLWWVVRGPSWRRAVGYAAIWGVAYHGTALSWITALHPMMWMGMSWLNSFTTMLFAWAFVALWGAAIGMIWAGLMVALGRWQSVTGLARVLVGTALWCAIEWLWSVGPLYWSPLSYTQSPGNLLALQLGQLSGPMTITAAIVSVNGLLAELWVPLAVSLAVPLAVPAILSARGGGEIGSRRRGWGNRRFGLMAIALFFTLHLLGWGLYARPLADRPERALAVGLIQGNIPTNQKLTSTGIQQARQVYLAGYETLVEQGAELVITPEGSIPQEWNAFLQDRNLLQRAVVKRGVPLVLGTFVRQDINDSRTPIMQSLLTLTPEGKVAGRYNKAKLVPLGEYLPLEKWLKPVIGRLSPLAESMVPGTYDQRLDTPFGPMAAGLCYESVFAELFRLQMRRGAQAIMTASNNDPYPARQMMQHHAQDVMRAVETDRWQVRVTNTGISGVVDPRGRSRWLSAPNERLTHLATIYRRQGWTPYVRWGDWLTPLLGAGALVTIAWLRRPAAE